MKEVKIKSFGFTKDTLDSYNKTIINSITENISVKTRAKSNNLEPLITLVWFLIKMNVNKKQASTKLFSLLALCLISILFILLKQKDYQFLADGNFSGLSFFFEIYAGREFIVLNLYFYLSSQ